MSRFEEVKSITPKLITKQKTKQLGYSDPTIKIYRHETNISIPYNRGNSTRNN